MRKQIEDAFREAIRQHRVPPGSAVPSSRILATELGVSRGVVVQAYDQLISEGYLLASQGAPTRVTTEIRVPDAEEPRPVRPTADFDFKPGEPDPRLFPAPAWQRAYRTGIRNLGYRDLGYGDPQGLLGLRVALSSYVARARGVTCSPRQVVVCTGCAQGLSVAGYALGRLGITTVAIEAPGHPEIRQIVEQTQLRTAPIRVDEQGLLIDDLERADVQAVVVSPAHQNPTGSILSPARRQQLVAWAHRTNGFIVEDDYDAEFRYDRPGVGALQGLAPERVIYLGSASKILLPALRLGWMVARGALLEHAIDVKHRVDNGSPVLQQAAYSAFIEAGELDRHVRRMRVFYKRRRDTLVEALSTHFPTWRLQGADAGLHLLAEVSHAFDVEKLVTVGERRSVRLYPTDRYTGYPGMAAGLVFGYARLTETEIQEGVRRLASGPVQKGGHK